MRQCSASGTVTQVIGDVAAAVARPALLDIFDIRSRRPVAYAVRRVLDVLGLAVIVAENVRVPMGGVGHEGGVDVTVMDLGVDGVEEDVQEAMWCRGASSTRLRAGRA